MPTPSTPTERTAGGETAMQGARRPGAELAAARQEFNADPGAKRARGALRRPDHHPFAPLRPVFRRVAG